MSKKERVVLVGLHLPQTKLYSIEDSLEELSQLVKTAGGEDAGRFIQQRDKPTPAYYIGKGRAEEIGRWCGAQNVDLVVFDDDLSPSQQRNLEKIIQRRVIDRTGLILDIFAQHAHTKEGQLQVELAQLNYMLPHLTGKGVELSQLGAGIGTRGPGETKLEVDRRKIKNRIAIISRKLEQVRHQRKRHRFQRQATTMPVIALVGYTNAGKSTLMNALTRAGVLVEDKLFATLDPTTRRMTLPNGQVVLISDTVGFIRKLPYQVVEAFKATLEEIADADLLLHVIDASHFEMSEQIATVQAILKELGLADKACLPVLNKIDRFKHGNTVNCLVQRVPNACSISALRDMGIEQLKQKIAEQLHGLESTLHISLSYAQSNLLALMHQKGHVFKIEYTSDHMLVEARVDYLTAGVIYRQLEEKPQEVLVEAG
ncbi:MAG: GTPase HflX [Candidatus Schekmanbacteria bacterium]|nr:GTPase HflX [Candidatus Schekmanbacteria bacterium]